MSIEEFELDGIEYKCSSFTYHDRLVQRMTGLVSLQSRSGYFFSLKDDQDATNPMVVNVSTENPDYFDKNPGAHP